MKRKLPISLMNIHANIFNKILGTIFNNKLKVTYVMIKWESPLGYNNSLTNVNQ